MKPDMRFVVSTSSSNAQVDFAALVRRFPNMSLGDLSDLGLMFGVTFRFRLVEIDPFLCDAWKRKVAGER